MVPEIRKPFLELAEAAVAQEGVAHPTNTMVQ
jgi:hypothetical protein